MHSMGHNNMSQENKSQILVVDDDPFILDSVSLLLGKCGYDVLSSENAADAMTKLRADRIDVVLTDIKMPHVSGVELLDKICKLDKEIPVILMTAYAELDVAIDAIKKGAFDFIIKPYKPEYLVYAIEKAIRFNNVIQIEKNYKNALEDTVKKKTMELADALMKIKYVSKEITQRLASAAEYKDTETGAHISRMSLYSQKIAQAMNMPSDFIEAITFASPMHDVGKIGIPDNILFKQSIHTPEETKIMKTHTTIGEKILYGSVHYHIQMSASIALNHHERWDGTGYPRGLKGEAIPIEGRIVMICDQYDALRSERPYKEALSHQETIEIITKGDGRVMPEHFCPKVFKAFIKIVHSFDEIFTSYSG